jgi:hypothetical protein
MTTDTGRSSEYRALDSDSSVLFLICSIALLGVLAVLFTAG